MKIPCSHCKNGRIWFEYKDLILHIQKTHKNRYTISKKKLRKTKTKNSTKIHENKTKNSTKIHENMTLKGADTPTKVPDESLCLE